MNKVKYFTLNNFLKLKVGDPNLFSRSVSIALGLALARSAPLPASKPDSATLTYSATAKRTIESAAAEFNENIVIDLDLCGAVARSVWLMRCGTTFPTPFIDLPEVGTPGDFFSSMSNAGFTMDPSTYEFINANKAAIFVMANRIWATMLEE